MLSSKKYLAEKIIELFIRPLSNVNPNVLTLIGIIPSILFFVFIINHQYLLAIIAFAGTILDLIDGMVARRFNKTTKFGGLLDSTLDRISDFLIISSFAFAGIVGWEIIAPLLLASFLISYIRARGEQNSPNSLAVGIVERTERLILIITALVFYVIFPNFFIRDFNIVEIIFVVLLILSAYTIAQRLIHAYKNL